MMQGEYLLDASAMLAVLLGEPGQEHVLAISIALSFTASMWLK